MKLTRNAKIFALINSITTVLFLARLNQFVLAEKFESITLWAIAYGSVWAISALLLGGTDKARSYRRSIDMQYMLVASVIALFSLWISKLFLPAIMPASYGKLFLASLLVIILTTVQYYIANKDPKGISKKDAFK